MRGLTIGSTRTPRHAKNVLLDENARLDCHTSITALVAESIPIRIFFILSLYHFDCFYGSKLATGSKATCPTINY